MNLALQIILWFSIFFVIYSYTIYPVLLVIFSYMFRKPVITDVNYQPVVGVLVPVHNEERVIKKKIDNILALDYPPDKLSVWIGSDCSTDKSEEIVKSYDNPRVHLWVAKERGGKTGIVNNLTPLIDAEIILFTDANTVHHKDCVKALIANYADPCVGGVAGHIEHSMTGEEESESGESIYRKFESKQKFLEGLLHSTISAFGGFYSIRKSLFRPIPPNSYSNDDVMIPMSVIAQGYRVIYEPKAISEEDMAGSTSREFSRRVRIGAGNFQAFFWLISFLNPLRGWPAFCYVSHKVTRWFSPIMLLTGYISCGFIAFSFDYTIYKMLFTTGTIFIVSGLLFKLIPIRLTRHVYYFLLMNFALFLGLFRYIQGIKSAAWSRTERLN